MLFFYPRLLNPFLFVPLPAGAFTCEAGFLCCQPRDYIKDGSLSREMLLATLRGPFPNLITYFTYIENMRRTKVVPVHYK